MTGLKKGMGHVLLHERHIGGDHERKHVYVYRAGYWKVSRGESCLLKRRELMRRGRIQAGMGERESKKTEESYGTGLVSITFMSVGKQCVLGVANVIVLCVDSD